MTDLNYSLDSNDLQLLTISLSPNSQSFLSWGNGIYG